MNKAKERQTVLKQMKQIYYTGIDNRIDWMGYPITEINKPSYHHIVKREDLLSRGESISATVENGAYLGKKSHEMLHLLEQIDYDLYLCWNDLFKVISNMRIYPVVLIWDTIYKMKIESENRINEYYNSKRLIK